MSGPAMAPAYTTVLSTTHTYSQPPPPSTHQHAEPKRLEWPQSVKDYVRRSFEPGREIPHISKVDMERKLKEVITRAAESGELLAIDWDSHPLPQELLYQEQMQRAQSYLSLPYYNHANAIAIQTESSPPFSRKRKVDDHSETSSDSATPPWRKNNANASSAFENRITYANKGQADRLEKRLKKGAVPMEPIQMEISSKFQEDLEKRRRRFEQNEPAATMSQKWNSNDDSYSSSHSNSRNTGPVIGICTKLEKNYFRLTSPPKPADVRPQHVLEQTLVLLKQKWKQTGDYNYICDQFKSMRQDLTVQHIKNQFTVSVYELHARIALERGDLGEYNQCQTQLRALYSLKLGGHPSEFLAYRILYFIHTGNRTGLNEILAELTPTDKDKPAIRHALEVRSALAGGNYHRFFRLYLDVPNMGAYLMDKFIVRERLSALAMMCKA
jgi:SAC3 family protein LENG8/THP3